MMIFSIQINFKISIISFASWHLLAKPGGQAAVVQYIVQALMTWAMRIMPACKGIHSLLLMNSAQVKM